MTARDETRIALLLAAVQFVNIVDFMIVMPLGPDFAGELGIPLSRLNLVAGAYMAAAGLSGALGAFVLDRFDRRQALVVALVGLATGTAGAALARGIGSLLVARFVAGAFGGPATALAYAIVTDLVPVERRGRALGTMMTSFSLASVLGVPAGLELARRGSWHTPFVVTAVLALLAAAGARAGLPPIRRHLDRPAEPVLAGFAGLLGRPLTRLSYLMSALQFVSVFVLVPNLAAYVQVNLDYPREHLGTLYLCGGLGSLLALRPIGWLVDRFGSLRVGLVGIALSSVVTWAGFVLPVPAAPVVAIFVAFMVCSTFRNVAFTTITTQVPRPEERARFMSFQSVVQHASAFGGTLIAAHLLSEDARGALAHFDQVAWVSIATMGALVPMLWIVHARLRAGLAVPAVAP